MTKTVYVVAWDFEGGGGFDWYFNAADQAEAYTTEKYNCAQFADSGWTAYQFNVEVPAELSNDEITNFIDDDLLYLCDTATIKYRAPIAHKS